MVARIYQQAKTAMQQGRAGTREWVLDYEPASPRQIEPLMGWTGGGDPLATDVRLTFPTRAQAIAYAERLGLAYEAEPDPAGPPASARSRVARPAGMAGGSPGARRSAWCPGGRARGSRSRASRPCRIWNGP